MLELNFQHSLPREIRQKCVFLFVTSFKNNDAVLRVKQVL